MRATFYKRFPTAAGQQHTLLFISLSSHLLLTPFSSFQVACGAPSSFACGCLLLASETLREKPGLWTSVLQPEEGDGTERFEDAPFELEDGGDAGDAGTGGKRQLAGVRMDLGGHEAGAKGVIARGPAPVAPQAQPGPSCTSKGLIFSALYEPSKRDPQFSGAQRSCWWEVSLLASHSHPSVAAMAQSLLHGTHVAYDGDPLVDLALSSFLDKWLQKKPKAARKAASAGPSARPMARRSATVDGAADPWAPEFASLNESDVKAEDVFFHRYFSAKEAAAAKAARAKAEALGTEAPAEEERSDSEEEEEDRRGAAQRKARAAAALGGAALEFSDSDEDSDLERALEEAEAEEAGEAPGSAAAPVWTPGLETGGDAPSDSDSDDARPVFADADEYEHILAAGGLPEGSARPGGDGDDDEEEDWNIPEIPEDDSDWGTPRTSAGATPKERSAKKSSGKKKEVAPLSGGGSRKAKPGGAGARRGAPEVTPRAAKRARKA